MDGSDTDGPWPFEDAGISERSSERDNSSSTSSDHGLYSCSVLDSKARISSETRGGSDSQSTAPSTEPKDGNKGERDTLFDGSSPETCGRRIDGQDSRNLCRPRKPPPLKLKTTGPAQNYQVVSQEEGDTFAALGTAPLTAVAFGRAPGPKSARTPGWSAESKKALSKNPFVSANAQGGISPYRSVKMPRSVNQEQPDSDVLDPRFRDLVAKVRAMRDDSQVQHDAALKEFGDSLQAHLNSFQTLYRNGGADVNMVAQLSTLRRDFDKAREAIRPIISDHYRWLIEELEEASKDSAVVDTFSPVRGDPGEARTLGEARRYIHMLREDIENEQAISDDKQKQIDELGEELKIAKTEHCRLQRETNHALEVKEAHIIRAEKAYEDREEEVTRRVEEGKRKDKQIRDLQEEIGTRPAEIEELERCLNMALKAKAKLEAQVESLTQVQSPKEVVQRKDTKKDAVSRAEYAEAGTQTAMIDESSALDIIKDVFDIIEAEWDPSEIPGGKSEPPRSIWESDSVLKSIIINDDMAGEKSKLPPGQKPLPPLKFDLSHLDPVFFDSGPTASSGLTSEFPDGADPKDDSSSITVAKKDKGKAKAEPQSESDGQRSAQRTDKATVDTFLKEQREKRAAKAGSAISAAAASSAPPFPTAPPGTPTSTLSPFTQYHQTREGRLGLKPPEGASAPWSSTPGPVYAPANSLVAPTYSPRQPLPTATPVITTSRPSEDSLDAARTRKDLESKEKELDKVQKKLGDKEAELTKAQREVKKLSDQLSKAQKDDKEKSDWLAQWQTGLKEKSQQLALSSTEAEAAKQDLARAQEEVKKSQEELALVRARTEEKQEELTRVIAELEKTREKLAFAEATVKDLEQGHGTLRLKVLTNRPSTPGVQSPFPSGFQPHFQQSQDQMSILMQQANVPNDPDAMDWQAPTDEREDEFRRKISDAIKDKEEACRGECSAQIAEVMGRMTEWFDDYTKAVRMERRNRANAIAGQFAQMTEQNAAIVDLNLKVAAYEERVATCKDLQVSSSHLDTVQLDNGQAQSQNIAPLPPDIAVQGTDLPQAGAFEEEESFLQDAVLNRNPLGEQVARQAGQTELVSNTFEGDESLDVDATALVPAMMLDMGKKDTKAAEAQEALVTQAANQAGKDLVEANKRIQNREEQLQVQKHQSAKDLEDIKVKLTAARTAFTAANTSLRTAQLGWKHSQETHKADSSKWMSEKKKLIVIIDQLTAELGIYRPSPLEVETPAEREERLVEDKKRYELLKCSSSLAEKRLEALKNAQIKVKNFEATEEMLECREAELIELKAAIDTLTEEKQGLEEITEELKKQHEIDVKRVVDKAQETVDAEIEKLMDENEEVKKELKEAEEKIKIVIDSSAQAQKSNKANTDNLNLQIKKLMDANLSLQEGITKAEKAAEENECLHKEVEELRDNIKRLEGMETNLMDTCKRLEKELREANDAKYDAEASEVTAKADLQAAKDEIQAQIDAACAELRLQLEATSKKLEDGGHPLILNRCENQLTWIVDQPGSKSQLDEKAKRIESLAKELDECELLRIRQDERGNDLEQAAEILCFWVGTANRRLNEQLDLVRGLTTETESLKKELRDSKTNANELKIQLGRAQDENTRLTGYIDYMQAQLEQDEKDRAQLRERVGTAETRLQVAQKALTELEGDSSWVLQDLERALTDWKAEQECADLNGKIKTETEDAFCVQEAKTTSFQISYDRLQRALQKAKDALASENRALRARQCCADCMCFCALIEHFFGWRGKCTDPYCPEMRKLERAEAGASAAAAASTDDVDPATKPLPDSLPGSPLDPQEQQPQERLPVSDHGHVGDMGHLHSGNFRDYHGHGACQPYLSLPRFLCQFLTAFAWLIFLALTMPWGNVGGPVIRWMLGGVVMTTAYVLDIIFGRVRRGTRALVGRSKPEAEQKTSSITTIGEKPGSMRRWTRAPSASDWTVFASYVFAILLALLCLLLISVHQERALWLGANGHRYQRAYVLDLMDEWGVYPAWMPWDIDLRLGRGFLYGCAGSVHWWMG
jgi:chromosome segregation ATPase